MTDKEILQKAIEKAEKNGYTLTQASFDFLMNLLNSKKPQMEEVLNYFIETKQHYQIIFDHNFAKAFWAESEEWPTEYPEDAFPYLGVTQRREDCVTAILCYEYHLQQMVLEKEPLKYLEKFLDE